MNCQKAIAQGTARSSAATAALHSYLELKFTDGVAGNAGVGVNALHQRGVLGNGLANDVREIHTTATQARPTPQRHPLHS